MFQTTAIRLYNAVDVTHKQFITRTKATIRQKQKQVVFV